MHVRRLAVLISAALIAGLLSVLGATPALAVQNGTVPGTSAPMWQTNGVVRAMVVTGGVLYVGGDFTSVRPPGSPAGSGEVGRSRLAAFDVATGALVTSFNPAPNGSVRSLALAPGGGTLYVGGDFTVIAGQSRSRVAAFTTSTRALTAFAPTVDGRVSALAASATAVYAGGSFGLVNGQGRRWIAGLNATNGQRIAAFAPVTDNVMYALAVSADGTRLYAGGAFTTMNGDTGVHGAAALSTADGSNLPFAAGDVIPTPSPGCFSHIKDIQVDVDSIYFAAEGTGGGCFDGTFAANQSDGSLKWVSRCLGATQGIEVLAGQLYTGSHAHDCLGDRPGDPDAFAETGWSLGYSRKLLARSTTDGLLSTWYPNTNGGTGEGLGPRVMATDGVQLFVGGEFTTVNGTGQQGLTRFSPTASPVAVPARPATPVAVPRGDGRVSVFVQSPLDIDDVDLVVRVYRGTSTTPIASAPARSLFWRQPVVAVEDSGLTPGTQQTYSVDVVAASGGTASPRATSAPVTVAGALTGYQAATAADLPSLQWRLGETAGPVTADSSPGLTGGTAWNAPQFGVAGAVPGDTAVRFNGTTQYVSTDTAVPAPSTFSVEAWVNTTSTAGGRIVGFGDNRGGYDFGGNPQLSGNYDKHLYMGNDGRVTFGVFAGGVSALTSPTALNDGQWHHVVGTQGPTGMTLYVDGVRQGRNGQTQNQGYLGFWRVGGDNLGGWPNQPSSAFLAGAIDEVAIYPAALPATAVAAHYSASGRTPQLPPAPTDAYGSSVVADGPSSYWRLDETGGVVAADASGNGGDGQFTGPVAYGVAGVIGAQGTATTLAAGATVVATASAAPSAFSAELWFRTSTTTGGRLVGFGNAQTGLSSAYDKHVYLTDDGRLVFGVYNGSFDTVVSAPGFADGQWHHVVATQGSGGMALHVDNVQVGTNPVTTNQGYAGFWRVGGDNLGAWPMRPTTDALAGTVDEVAVYDVAIDAAAVNRHWTASGRSGAPDTVAPTVAITSPVADATPAAGVVPVAVNAADDVAVTAVDVLVDGALVGTATAAPYTVEWTATSGAYVLTAVARDAAGNETTSAPVPVTVQAAPDTVAPSQVTGLVASDVGTTEVTLTWEAATDDTGVTGYVVSRNGTALPGAVTGLTTTDTGLAPGTTYTYSVRATDAAGNLGPASAALPVNTVAAPTPPFVDGWTGIEGAAWSAPWTSGSANGSVTTASGTGQLAVTDVAGAYARSQLGIPAQADAEVTFTYQWSAGTALAYANVWVRGSGGWQNSYRPRNGYGIQIQSNSGTVLLQRNVNGTLTTLQSVPGAQTVGAGIQQVRLRVVGSTVQFKIWSAGQVEPAAWEGVVTDTAVAAAGQPFVSLNRASANLGNKSFRLDDFTISQGAP